MAVRSEEVLHQVHELERQVVLGAASLGGQLVDGVSDQRRGVAQWGVRAAQRWLAAGRLEPRGHGRRALGQLLHAVAGRVADEDEVVEAAAGEGEELGAHGSVVPHGQQHLAATNTQNVSRRERDTRCLY
jgi:hypothetical protein